jgi:hypothetical protein
LAVRPGRRQCGCWDAVGNHYGTATFGSGVIPVRQRQLRRPARYLPRPLLSRLLQPGGRRSADVRIRLWLWCVFEAHARADRGEEPVVQVGRRTLAARLHLVAPRDIQDRARLEAGARRVDNAWERLRRETVVARWQPSGWRVLQDDGSEKPYRSETGSELDERMARRKDALAFSPHGQKTVRYESISTRRRRSNDGTMVTEHVLVGDAWEQEPLEIPIFLWANCWVSELSGAALLVLLVLLDSSRDRHPAEFVVPKIRRSQYGLGKESWTKGRDELAAHGLLEVSKGKTAGSVVRDKYTLHLRKLATSSACPYSSA